jgi:hypothetical protein
VERGALLGDLERERVAVDLDADDLRLTPRWRISSRAALPM